MAVNPNFTNANSFTPYASGGGGGGTGTFNILNIAEGGTLRMGSSVGLATEQIWNKDQAGNLQSIYTMQYFGSNYSQPQSLTLTFQDQSGNLDNQLFGDVIVGGGGTYSGGTFFALNTGHAGTGVLGQRLINANNGNTLATYATYGNSNWNLFNLSTINAGTNTANAVALMSSLKGTFPTSFI